jgi:glc operon protein GlcG
MHRLLSATLALSSLAFADSNFSERKSLTLAGARQAIDAATAQARRLNATGVIAVVDEGGNLMALERLDGTFGAGANISIGKARTAALFKKPTKFFEDVVAKGRTSMVALNDFTPLQGGVPISIDGQIVGAIGVSGASSAQQDEELALAGAASFQPAPKQVTFFDSAQVADAFSKGAVLFNTGASYMVHASRREAPGLAEIHTRDADIVYVLEGTATFITGGAALEQKVTGPDEIRGSSITGGESRQLKKGDVIIVPAGVPHQFKEVSQPFLYYVVKAR